VIYASVCSGIGTDAVAWHPLGWESAFFSEIEPFPSALLRHYYPEVPNLGDFTRISADAGPIDLLAGGTPCQAFSVAGRRAGLDDPRGNLTLEFLALAGRLRPRWLVWENVPGVLSIDGGRTFGAFLGLLGKLGYGWAYRVLDAQYFGVPQRRRRVFVVGHLGDWRPAAAVLFERTSLSGNPAPSREAGQGVTGSLAARTRGGGGLGTDFDLGGGIVNVPPVSLCLNGGGQRRIDGESETFVCTGQGWYDESDVAATIRKGDNNGNGQAREDSGLVVTHSLRADGFDASEDGTGRGTPIIPILEAGARTGMSTDDPRAGIGIGEPGDPMYTLQGGKQHAVAVPPPDRLHVAERRRGFL
jgi:DNA (cytosine-5)-methyltransferase 1